MKLVGGQCSALLDLLTGCDGDADKLQALVETWPPQKFAQAMAAYPTGRAIFETCKSNIYILQTKGKNTSELKTLASEE